MKEFTKIPIFYNFIFHDRNIFHNVITFLTREAQYASVIS